MKTERTIQTSRVVKTKRIDPDFALNNSRIASCSVSDIKRHPFGNLDLLDYSDSEWCRDKRFYLWGKIRSYGLRELVESGDQTICLFAG